jgi:hypothetical protein
VDRQRLKIEIGRKRKADRAATIGPRDQLSFEPRQECRVEDLAASAFSGDATISAGSQEDDRLRRPQKLMKLPTPWASGRTTMLSFWPTELD